MLYLILYLAEVIVFFQAERRMWKTIFTPLNMLMLPFTFTTLVAIVFSYADPYTPNYYLPSLVLWMIGLVVFWIPSVALCQLDKSNGAWKGWDIRVGYRDDNYKMLKNVAFGIILISLLKLRSMSGNMDSFGDADFSSEYQSSGVLNHLSVLLGTLFSYAVYKADWNHKSAFIIIAGALIGMYAVGTKSWIIAPFLIGYLARLMTGKTTFSVKTTLVPALIVFVIFFLSYYLSIVLVMGNEASTDFFSFILMHFIDYLSGSSLTLSIDYQRGFLEPDMTMSLFGPIVNFMNLITGDKYINVINPVFIDIGSLSESNVRTFFGTIYAYSHSPIVFVLVPLVWSSAIYLLFRLSRRSHSIFLLLALCGNLTFLIFGFFDFYWSNLSCYEMPVILIILHFLCYKKRKLK